MSSAFRALVAAAVLAVAPLLGLSIAQAQVQAPGTMVRLHTTQGPIDIRLLDAEAPKTVANFLAYVRAGDFSDVMFHRSVPGFVIQGGGFRWTAAGNCCPAVTSRGKIPSEFSATRSNLRGTVAMALFGSDRNSATSQWFVNLANNAANLDNQNGGFTVFARVTAPGMVVSDRIAALPVVNAGAPFNELPVFNYTGPGIIQRDNAVLVTRATEFPPLSSQTASDRIFNYLEAAFPQYLSPSAGLPGTVAGYSYRYYGASDTYLATKDGQTWVLAPAVSPGLIALGPMADWLATAQAAGY